MSSIGPEFRSDERKSWESLDEHIQIFEETVAPLPEQFVPVAKVAQAGLAVIDYLKENSITHNLNAKTLEEPWRNIYDLESAFEQVEMGSEEKSDEILSSNVIENFKENIGKIRTILREQLQKELEEPLEIEQIKEKYQHALCDVSKIPEIIHKTVQAWASA